MGANHIPNKSRKQGKRLTLRANIPLCRCPQRRYLLHPARERSLSLRSPILHHEHSPHHRGALPCRRTVCIAGNSRRAAKGSRCSEKLTRQDLKKLENQNGIQESEWLSARPPRVCDRSRGAALAWRFRLAEQHAVADEGRCEDQRSLGTRRIAFDGLPVPVIQPEILRSPPSRIKVELSREAFVPRLARSRRISLSSQPQEKVT